MKIKFLKFFKLLWWWGFIVCFVSKGTGDLNIKCEVVDRMLVSETYTIEDCYAYVTSLTSWTDVTNKGTSYKFSPFTLPTNHRIELKLKSTNALKITCGDTTHVNSGGWFEWIYSWFLNTNWKTMYYRDSNNGEQSTGTSTQYPSSTSVIYALEYNGTSLQAWIGDTRVHNLISYDPLTLTRLIRLDSSFGTLADNLDWIKVKQL